MTIPDIIIIAIVGLFTAWGLWRGFIRELAGLVGLLLGIALSSVYAARLAPMLPPQTLHLKFKTLIAGILIILASWVAVKFIACLVCKIFIHGPLSTLDRLLGGLFGAVKGGAVLLVALTILIISPFDHIVENQAKKSPLLRALLSFTPPLVERYKGSVMTGAMSEISRYLPKDQALPSKKTQRELAGFLRSYIETTDQETVKARIEELSPEARTYLKQLTEILSRQPDDPNASVEEIPPDLMRMFNRVNLKQLAPHL